MTIAPFVGIAEPLQVRTLGVIVDNAGSPITTGLKGMIEVPFPGRVVAWRLLGAPAGNVVVDVWKANAAIPTVANSITAGAKPTLSGSQRAVSAVPDTWTRRVDINDVFAFNVDSASTITQLTIELDIQV